MLQRIGNDINVPDNLFGLRREPARTFACGVLVLNGFFDCYKGDMQLEQKIDLQIRRSELQPLTTFTKNEIYETAWKIC